MGRVKPGIVGLRRSDLSALQIAHLERRIWIDAEKPNGDEGCWYASIYRLPKGYGTVAWGRYKRLAHRASYALKHGEAPADRNVCHRCDHPRCSNPDHLFLGTGEENTADMFTKNRSGRSRLTKEQVLRIRSMYASGGMSVVTIANIVGTASSNASNIVRGKGWRQWHDGSAIPPSLDNFGNLIRGPITVDG